MQVTLSDIIRAQAALHSNVTVELDRSYGTVCISAEGEEDIFMQGDDADQFIAEVDKLYEEAQDVTEDEAALSVASPYIDCIWS